MIRRRFPPRVAPWLLTAFLVAGLGCPQAPPAAVPGGQATSKGRAVKAADEEAVRDLLGVMRRRLLLMNEVARTKWATKRPVSDPTREAAMLQDLAQRGQAVGLDPRFTRNFFEAQIEAAKLIQQERFDHWQATRTGPVLESVTELPELREQIDALNQRLLKALAAARPWLLKETGWEELIDWSHEELVGTGITDAVRSKAVTPLLEKKTDLPPGFKRNPRP
jgi:chorismate mutase